MRVTKEYKFEASHLLELPYPSPCRRSHGHGYRVVVEVEGEVGDTGMVLDFNRLDEVVEPIIAELDHKLLAPERFVTRHPSVGAVTVAYPERTFHLPRDDVAILDDIDNSTSENLAWWIARAIERNGERVAKVTVKETERTSASYP